MSYGINEPRTILVIEHYAILAHELDTLDRDWQKRFGAMRRDRDKVYAQLLVTTEALNATREAHERLQAKSVPKYEFCYNMQTTKQSHLNVRHRHYVKALALFLMCESASLLHEGIFKFSEIADQAMMFSIT